MKAAGLDGFTFHMLRHTAASQLVMAGVDLYTLQNIMGWKTIQMAMRYGHLSEAHKSKAMEALDCK